MVNKERKQELKNVLKRLNEGENVEEVKEEARELLENMDARELSEAEQQLIDEGLKETELRHLCSAHIEAMSEQLEELKTEVSGGHPLHTLIVEHEEILKILENLEKINTGVQEMKNYDSDNDLFTDLKEIGKHLIETERHHEREEEVLFPEIDRKGVTGPTRIMRMEHEDLWPGKKKINDLAQNVDEMDFQIFKRELKQNSEYLITGLRDHIFKENNILYPAAYDLIPGIKWEEIRAKCDQIGYCCFTPELKSITEEER